MVTFFCSGYSSVLTALNIVAKETPKPLTGPKKLAIDDLARTGAARIVRPVRTVRVIRTVRAVAAGVAAADTVADAACQDRHRTTRRQMLARHRRHREPAGVGIERRRTGEIFFGLAFAPLLLIGTVIDEGTRDDDDRHDHDPVDELLAVEHLDGGLDHDPDQADRDQELPAELHELVVAKPR